MLWHPKCFTDLVSGPKSVTCYEPRALINPFRHEEFVVRITANRRRWIHVFPVDRLGRAKLAHHYVGARYVTTNEDEDLQVVGTSTVRVLQTVEPVRSFLSVLE